MRFGAVHTDSPVECLPTVVPVGSITSGVLQPLRAAFEIQLSLAPNAEFAPKLYEFRTLLRKNYFFLSL